jgi:hypothetical protein
MTAHPSREGLTLNSAAQTQFEDLSYIGQQVAELEARLALVERRGGNYTYALKTDVSRLLAVKHNVENMRARYLDILEGRT